MKHNTKEIALKAVEVMNSIGWRFEEGQELNPFYTSKEEQIEIFQNFQDHPKYEDVISEIRNYWTIGFEFEKEAELRGSMFLKIDDDKCEPFEVSHKQARIRIVKNDEGGYSTIE